MELKESSLEYCYKDIIAIEAMLNRLKEDLAGMTVNGITNILENITTCGEQISVKSDTTSKEYTIELIGCDDSTIFDMSLTDDEVELLKKVSELSNNVSTYQCMPTLEIEEKKYK